MVAYSFKDRFVGPISSREKRQTIRRAGKKRHARPGDRLQLYTGPRMRPRKFGEATCDLLGVITLDFKLCEVWIDWNDEAREKTMLVTMAELDDFARSDGFTDWEDLESFWKLTHDVRESWTGVIITWGDSFDPATAGTTA